MIPRPASLGLVGLSCAVLAASCTGTNPLFCDDQTPCTGARSFCDVNGSFPASGGVRNTCIEPPSDTSCNQVETCEAPGAPHCSSDGECVECLETSHCGGGTSVCDTDTNTCVEFTCVPGVAGDEACAALDETTPYCAEAGHCVECLSASHCESSAAPVCDSVEFQCRTCVRHGECPSGACHIDSGQCYQPDEIVYVSETGADAGGCGTFADPCETISTGLTLITSERDAVVVAEGSYPEALVLANAEVTIVGVGDVQLRPDLGADENVVAITGASDVTLENLTLTMNVGGTESDAVFCDGTDQEMPVLTMWGVTLTGAFGRGLATDRCQVTVESSTVSDNLLGGISINYGRIVMRNSFIIENGRTGGSGSPLGGIEILETSGSDSVFEFNTVTGNGIRSDITLKGSALFCTGSGLSVSSSIIRQGDGGGQNLIMGDCALTYCNTEGELLTGEGNQTDDPDFIDVSNGNFHLQPDSPCVDAADPDAELMVDFDGDARPHGERADIGADELAPGGAGD